jgi:hypothetical protein
MQIFKLVHNGASATRTSQAVTTAMSDKREDYNAEVDEYEQCVGTLRLVQNRIW